MKVTKSIKNLFLALFCILGISSLLYQPTFAEDVCSSSAPAEVKKAAGCSGNDDALKYTITNILNAVIAISGLVAVIFIIVGGVQYMTSAGDAAKVEKGKKTILYACIGLIICALAFAIVNFVITNLLRQSSSPSDYQNSYSCKEAGFKWKNDKCINE